MGHCNGYPLLKLAMCVFKYSTYGIYSTSAYDDTLICSTFLAIFIYLIYQMESSFPGSELRPAAAAYGCRRRQRLAYCLPATDLGNGLESREARCCFIK